MAGGMGGIQSWSVGEIFPWRIVVVGHGPGRVQAVAPGGRLLAEFPFSKMGKGGDFGQAHDKAEDACRADKD